MKTIIILLSIGLINSAFSCSQSVSFYGKNIQKYMDLAKVYTNGSPDSSVVEISVTGRMAGPSDIMSCLTRIQTIGIYDVIDTDENCTSRVQITELEPLRKSDDSYLIGREINPETGKVESVVGKLEANLTIKLINKACIE